jgi:ATP adenylyltransferase
LAILQLKTHRAARQSAVEAAPRLRLLNYQIPELLNLCTIAGLKAALPSATLAAMDYLSTPWRYAYITNAAKSGEKGACIFCELPKLPDREANIVYRGQRCFIILNSFPYTSGHVMIVPFAHLDELSKLPEATAHEMMNLSQKMERVLRHVYSPDGINLGMNIGRSAGAGVAGHVHMHVLPRWVGDTNFMTVTAETRVLPESLEQTYERIRGALDRR